MKFFNTSNWSSRGVGFIQGARIGVDMGLKGNLPFVIIGGAVAGAGAPRGRKISSAVANVTTYGPLAVAGGILGTMLGGPIGGYIGTAAIPMLIGEPIEKAVAGIIQPMIDFGSNQRRMKFGGDYRDTQIAYTMRQVAAREMSGSLMNARQYLGMEASFMHQ